jgi:CheY-like chemotaxis protein
MKGDREQIIEAGCDDYLAKPIDPELLQETVGKWIENEGPTNVPSA